MKTTILTSILLTILSCSVSKRQSGKSLYIGEYYKEFRDGLNYSLILKSDSSFSYTIKGGILPHSGSHCEGKWSLLNDTLFLKCSEEDLTAQLAQGYMNDREKKVIFINKKKLKIDGFILKRVSQ